MIPAERAEPTNKFGVLRLVEWQYLDIVLLQFLLATFVNHPADVEHMVVVEVGGLIPIASSIRRPHRPKNSTSVE